MANEPPDRERPVAETGRAPIGKRVMTLLIGVAAVAAVAAVGVFAYKEGLRRGAEGVAPVITAAPGPDKVKPTEPGGMEVPNQDKQIYNRLSPESAPKQVERLMPPPETPMAPPGAPGASPAPPASAPAAPSSSLPTASAPPTPSAPPTATPEPSRATMQPPSMEAPAAPAPKPPPSAAAPVAGEGYRVQLAALRTEAQANAVIARAKRTNGDILGKLTFSIARADLGTRGIYYRVQAGPLPDAAAAKTLCARLKARKQGCLVVRP